MIAKCGGDGRENKTSYCPNEWEKKQKYPLNCMFFEPCTLKGRLGLTRGDPEEDPGHGKLIVLILKGKKKLEKKSLTEVVNFL